MHLPDWLSNKLQSRHTLKERADLRLLTKAHTPEDHDNVDQVPTWALQRLHQLNNVVTRDDRD